MIKSEGSKQFELSESSYKDQLEYFFNTAIQLNLNVAIWRKPGEEKINAICQLDRNNSIPDELETAPSGFYFAPFDESAKNARHYIRADIRFEQESKSLSINPTFSNTELVDKFEKHFQSLPESEVPKISDYLGKSDIKDGSKDIYLKLVEDCISTIDQGQYQKIVPARQKSIVLKNDFKPVRELFKLCEAYPNAFVSLVFVPSAGMWMGATPELLLSLEENKLFKTEALAGTQNVPNDFILSKAAWTQKEIEEQALVSRYIINCFKSIRLREFEEYGPKTVKAGNLIHLKTIFSVDMEEVNYPLLGTVMLDLLHPTSAICGMPMKPAAKFLKKNEGIDRGYFSGYLGPCNIDNNTSLYVNLRCMHILKKKAQLFAGAGVTEDSDPESEWLETEMKMRTLLNVIQAD